jgi:hypothetical protein
MGRKSVLIAVAVFVFLSAFSFGYAAESPIKLKFANFIVPAPQTLKRLGLEKFDTDILP